MSAALGARIHGADLSVEPPQATVEALRDAVYTHQVVFVTDQKAMSDAAHLDLMRRLGTPYIHPLARAMGITEPIVEHIVDDEDHPPYQDRWHTDVTWDTTPPTLGSLRAIDVPATGGDTLWASMHAAWDGLSAPIQTLLDGLDARHDLGDGEAFRSKAGEEAYAAALAMFPDTRHPIVGDHPRSGRRHLYVNRQFTASIPDLTEVESDTLLGFLTDHAVQPQFCVRHRWTAGDFCIWDERTTQHFATADHFPDRREMARVAVIDRSAGSGG